MRPLFDRNANLINFLPQVSVLVGLVRQLVHQLYCRVGKVKDFGETSSVPDRSRHLQSLRQRLSFVARKGQTSLFILAELVSVVRCQLKDDISKDLISMHYS